MPKSGDSQGGTIFDQPAPVFKDMGEKMSFNAFPPEASMESPRHDTTPCHIASPHREADDTTSTV